jgi:hypothetical protein
MNRYGHGYCSQAAVDLVNVNNFAHTDVIAGSKEGTGSIAHCVREVISPEDDGITRIGSPKRVLKCGN